MAFNFQELYKKIFHRENIVLLVISIVVALAFLFFIYQAATYRSRMFKQSELLLHEYKTAKALEILTKLRNTSDGKDETLNFTIFYSYVKSSSFAEAAKEFELIKEISETQKHVFLEAVDQLSVANQIPLILKLFPKAYKLLLEQQFFIDLSQHRTAIKEELEILESGLDYIAAVNTAMELDSEDELLATRKLENHLIRRYIEIANIYRGSKEYYLALKYLEKARLRVKGDDNESPYKAEVYLNIGLAYKHLKKYSTAWENIRFAEKLGSETARDMINNLHRH